jgi:beta-glucosidase
MAAAGTMVRSTAMRTRTEPRPPARYLDASLPIKTRVADLLRRMTLEEKVAQLGAHSLDSCLEGDEFSPEKFRGVIKDLGIGALHGATLHARPNPTEINLRVVDQVQHYLVEHTRPGIPAIITAEGIHGHMADGATVFPHSIAMASSWDSDLLHQVASVIAREARAVGVSQLLCPVLDLAREPRWGRCQETYGEDPYLAARMGVAYITGLQGNGPAIDRDHVAATAKHFAAHGTPEGGINCGPVHAGPREVRELYLPPFEAVVREARVACVMPCYSEFDGIPCAKSKELLTGILRQEWGFEGYTYSDWGAIEMLHTLHHTAADLAEAGKQALEAGHDLDAPVPQAYGRNLLRLARSGRVAQKTLDAAVGRVLRTKFLLGLFENPYSDRDRAMKIRDCAEHRALARRAACESIVLLKNDGGLLPLSESISSIAVIGPNADSARLGNYSGTNGNLVTVVQGIRNRVRRGTQVAYARGCGVFEPDTSGIAEAVEAARASDVAVLVLGESTEVCEEGVDQTDLELPGVQTRLAKAIHETGTPVVVVLINGRPLALPWLAETVPAIVEAWWPGEEGGHAIADVLFGDFNPCGRLPVSLPRSVGHIPSYYNYKPSARGVYHKPGAPDRPGRDYVFSPPTALFEFGHGLSYTTFEYGDLRVSPKTIAADGTVRIRLRVSNTGPRAGAEVVQVYVNDVVSSVTTPVKALRRFAKVGLEPGETRTITFALSSADLHLLNEEMEWVVEPGEFEVVVGCLTDRFRVR